MFRLHSDMRAKGLSSVRPSQSCSAVCLTDIHADLECHALLHGIAGSSWRKVLPALSKLLWCMVRHISHVPTDKKFATSRVAAFGTLQFRAAAAPNGGARRFTDVWSFGNVFSKCIIS